MGKQNWPVVKLGEVVTIETGQKDVNAGNPDGEYPFFTCSRKTYRINTYTHDAEAVLVAGNGDFSVKYYTGKFDVYQRTYVLKKKNNQVDLKFIFELLKNGLTQLTANNQGSTIKYLKMGDFVNFEIPLPSIETQHKIATILASVDAATDTTQKVIDQTERLKKGLMQQLFTRGIGHTKFKQTEIGEVPEEWEVTKLVSSGLEILDGDRGLQYPKQKEFTAEGFCLFLSTQNINKGSFNFNVKQFVSRERDQLLRKGKLQRGDLVLTTRGTVGRIAYYDNAVPFDHIRINSGMVILRTNELFFPEFLLQQLLSDRIQQAMKTISSGSAQPQLPIGSLNHLRVVRPPMAEQRQIIEIFHSIDKKSEVYMEVQQNQIRLKRGLMNNLLTGRVLI